jgi:hypothetical protein
MLPDTCPRRKVADCRMRASAASPPYDPSIAHSTTQGRRGISEGSLGVLRATAVLAMGPRDGTALPLAIASMG